MNHFFLVAAFLLLSHRLFSQNESSIKKNEASLAAANFKKVSSTEVDQATIENNLNKHSILFTPNLGQFPKPIEFVGNVNGSQFLIAKNEVGFRFVRNPQKPEILSWSISFLRANENSKTVSQNLLTSKSNYLIGEKENWKTDVPNYGKIKIEKIYKNIDIVYYGNGEHLEYDYHVLPKGKLSDIQMKCNNIKSLSINVKGELEINTEWGTLIEKIPYSYQIINGKNQSVEVRYTLYDEFTFGFEVNGTYEKSKELVIDPTTLIWSTFVGGTNAKSNGYVTSLGRDLAGNTYGTGFYSLDFPVTVGAYDVTYNKGCGIASLCGSPALAEIAMDAYVFKMNSTGTTLIYCTYIGGSGDDFGYDIFVNNSGEVYVTGETSDTSADVSSGIFFPTTSGAYDQTFNGGSENTGDVFVFKLNAAGNNLDFSTFLGGNTPDVGRAISVNAAGEVYVAGSTSSVNFPTTLGAYNPVFNGGNDAFFSKLNATGTTLLYSTYIGGASNDQACDLSINSANEAVIIGMGSAGFPSTVPNYGPLGGTDAYLLTLNPAGLGLSDLTYSKLMGGASQDIGARLVQGAGNKIYMAGGTASINFPTTVGAFQASYGGTNDFYFLLIDIGLDNVLYSTFLGGSGGENIILYNGGPGPLSFIGLGLLVNLDNDVLIVGGSASTNYPITPCAYQAVNNGGDDMVFTKISPDGLGVADLVYSTYIGGTNDDYGASVFSDFAACKEEILIALTTHSSNFPTTVGSFMPVKGNGGQDQPALLRLGSVVTANFRADTVCLGNPTSFTDITNQCGLLSPLSEWKWIFGDGDSSLLQNPTHTFTTSGNHSVTLVVGCPKDTITQIITVKPTPSINVSPSAICAGGTSTLTASGGADYVWSTSETTSAITVSPTITTSYSITVTTVGCSATASATVIVGVAIVPVITGDTSICNGNSTTLTTAGGTYLWSTGETSSAITVSPNTMTSYSVTVTSGSCTGSVSQTVTVNPLPTPSITGIPTICNGNSTTLTASGGDTYSWSTTEITTAITVSPTSNTTYTVIATDLGCSGATTVSVIVNSIPTPSITGTTTICNGNTTTLTASGGGTYNWSTTETTTAITVSPTSNTTYTVIANNAGCTGSTIVVVSIVSPPIAIATGDTVCAGETFNLTSSGGVTYSWNGPNAFTSALQNPSITNSTLINSGTYTVTVSNGSCSETATAMVTVNSTPSTNAGSDVMITPGSSTTLTATGGTTYTWTPTTGLNCDTCASVIATPTATVIYCVQSAMGTCSSIDCVTITVEPPCPSNKDLAVPNAFSPNADGHNDDFCLQGWNSCIETFIVLIYDRWGEKVFESEKANFCWDGIYKGKVMDTAVFVYYIKATFTNGNEVVKKGNMSLIK